MTDDERRIAGGSVFVLSEVQDHIREFGIDALNFAADKATEDLLLKLNWKPSDVCGFILSLGSHRYHGSQWCYGSGTPKVPFATDAYIMGYNRFTKSERQAAEPPWIYFKFGFCSDDQTVEIFSIRPADEL
ncbi:hypothetical protein HHL21_05500 [Massilia sp. RP-1-19]|uniref:Uncharacterized protein n=1 Tax=Massilia polaris TaxID=2728846 RepID=A0A848HKU4_9BURK|nr:hypothetical protein [Massilia polaris]NML60551.1 hypothetical protein [Massilia polaris]